ncbi:MAG TPA: tetratricopeptide repeat protein [Kiritimatiellia bacterium]|nr:tetratricopeptide repeat protein [Kiritimatiellia bacterium]
MTSNRRPSWTSLAIGVALFLLVVALFSPSLSYDFLDIDDNIYITDNPHVLQGLTVDNLRWAFTSIHEAYWIPVTWISYMIDSYLFGNEPWGYRLTNILLHALNAVLAWILLARITGNSGRAFAVAILFALHPMRLESVVWIAERKDVLSGMFWLLTIAAYTRYTQSHRSIHLAGSLIAMALGLMTKPALVTLPFVLLLLDAWPLRRLQGRGGHLPPSRLFLEKLPHFLLASSFSILTVITQRSVGAVRPASEIPLLERLLSLPVHYGHYLKNTLWPSGLSMYYPPPTTYPIDASLLWLLILSTLTVITLLTFRNRPYLLVGWFWFLGVLVPMIGLVRVGAVVVADRFSYLPHLGLGIAVVWGLSDLLQPIRMRWLQPLLVSTAAVALAASTWVQQPVWTNTITAMENALRLTGESEFPMNNLGVALNKAQRPAEAKVVLARALELVPHSASLMNNLGLAHLLLREIDEAVALFERARDYGGDPVMTDFNLGRARIASHRHSEAIELLQPVVDTRPDFAEAVYFLGLAHASLKHFDHAEPLFIRSLELKPGLVDALVAYAVLLNDVGRTDEAAVMAARAVEISPQHVPAWMVKAQIAMGMQDQPIAIQSYRKVLRIDSSQVTALNNLAWMLATSPDGAQTNQQREALDLAIRAAEITQHSNPAILNTLAAAYAASGKFEQAEQIQLRAIHLARESGRPETESTYQHRLDLYLNRQPYRTPSSSQHRP